ncbi:hypothetical protein IWX76_000136 [Pedobacter sp. CAN_A7]
MKQFLLLIRENADYGNLSIEEMEATKKYNRPKLHQGKNSKD